MTAHSKGYEVTQPLVTPLANIASLQERAFALVTGLSALPEDQMQAERWRGLLLDAEAAPMMVAFFEILTSGESRARALLPSLLIARNQLPFPQRFAIAAELKRLGSEALSLFFRAAQEREEGRAVVEPPIRAPGRERPLNLGERRAAARGREARLLEQLLKTRDARTLKHLLQNPRLLERDVLKIASRRPQRAALLAQLSVHPRWGRRHAVRAAIVENPSCPPVLLALDALLHGKERRKVKQLLSKDPHLPNEYIQNRKSSLEISTLPIEEEKTSTSEEAAPRLSIDTELSATLAAAISASEPLNRPSTEALQPLQVKGIDEEAQVSGSLMTAPTEDENGATEDTVDQLSEELCARWNPALSLHQLRLGLQEEIDRARCQDPKLDQEDEEA